MNIRRIFGALFGTIAAAGLTPPPLAEPFTPADSATGDNPRKIKPKGDRGRKSKSQRSIRLARQSRRFNLRTHAAGKKKATA